MILFIDTETRSSTDLLTRGGRLYAAGPDTELLCAVAILVDDTGASVYAWTPWPGPISEWRCSPPRTVAPLDTLVWHSVLTNSDDPPEAVLEAVRAGARVVAHNAGGFDKHVWDGLGLPDPASGWEDTTNLARRRGLPGALDKIGRTLFGQGKDEGGRKLMLKHSLPQKPKRGETAGGFLDPAPAALTSIIRYCARDALLMAALWFDERLGDDHPDDLVLAAHEVIDERGVPIDLELAGHLAAIETQLATNAEARALAHGVGGTLLRAPPALRLWLQKEHKVDLPDLTGQAVREALARTDLPQVARDVLEARLAVARVTGGKLQSLRLQTDPLDARLRGAFAYYGAQTGRWAGRGAQVQNFPRAADKLDAAALVEELAALPIPGAIARLTTVATSRKTTAPALLGTLLRCVVAAPGDQLIATVDLSQIEARGLLWLAGDDQGLEVYRAYDADPKVNPDPYRVMAASMYAIPTGEVTPTQRQAGKVAVLACGYQGGPGAVERFARKSGIDLAAAGVSSSDVVEAWRDATPLVAGTRTGKTLEREDGSLIVLRRGGLWKDLQRAARACVESGQDQGADAAISFHREGVHLICVLPSGRPIVYRDARIELVPSKWDASKTRPVITYASPKGMRVSLYGGLLAENVVQALCRDLLAAALVRLEEAGLDVVLHVHDEVGTLVKHKADLDRVVAIVEDSPPWAAGLPVKTSSAVGKRWSK